VSHGCTSGCSRPSLGKPIEPYFPRHHERDTYVTLLQRTNPATPDALLKAALVRRAIADVQRILRLRDDKQALQNLLQKGSVGDDLWNSFVAAEKELEAEIVEVHAEANSFVEGWGHVLFQTASEMLANEKTRAIVEQIPLERARNGIHTIVRPILSVLLTIFQR
jgi:translocation protein SEC66